MVADLLLPLVVGISAQAQHVIVDKASAAKRPGKNHFLLSRRVKPKFV